tara:strand:+ start:2367 stop:2513 length:147 start_codon:yes stop_codon:yes gene_type:complete
MKAFKSNCCEENVNMFDMCIKCEQENGVHVVDESDSHSTEVAEDIDGY